MQSETGSSTAVAGLQAILWGRNPRRTLVRLVVLAIVCFVTFKFILVPIRVTGVSMLPTYRNGSVNFVNRLAYLWHGPRRGDVVGIRLSDHGGFSIMYMKRIIGLPGETVAFQDGQTLINGKPLQEPYLKFPCDWNSASVTLDSNQYYVVGDNRSMPEKQHVHGRAKRSQIVGKVLL